MLEYVIFVTVQKVLHNSEEQGSGQVLNFFEIIGLYRCSK